MSPNDCPPPDVLNDYLLGKPHREDPEEIDTHIQSCNRCQSTLEEFESESDTFVERLRQPEVPLPYLNEPQCQQAMQDVARFGSQLQELSEATQASREDASSSQDAHATTIGPYCLLEELGAGGMGTVYKATHTKLKRTVAVKILPSDRMKDPHAVARFEREMEAVGKLEHPNIVRATDAGEIDGKHFLVMEHVDGLDLSAVARAVDSLDVADACEVIRQAAIGLQHASEHGLIHRDIKPSNLMLTKTGQVKILDVAVQFVQLI